MSDLTDVVEWAIPCGRCGRRMPATLTFDHGLTECILCIAEDRKCYRDALERLEEAAQELVSLADTDWCDTVQTLADLVGMKPTWVVEREGS